MPRCPAYKEDIRPTTGKFHHAPPQAAVALDVHLHDQNLHQHYPKTFMNSLLSIETKDHLYQAS